MTATAKEASEDAEVVDDIQRQGTTNPTNQHIIQLRDWAVGQDEPLVILYITEVSPHVYAVQYLAPYGTPGQT